MTELFHVSSVLNRESIRRHGLDWRRMGAAPGIAGPRVPQVAGCFLAIGEFERRWFTEMNNTGGPVDVWRVDNIDTTQLATSMEGHRFYPGPIGPTHLTLVEMDVAPVSR